MVRNSVSVATQDEGIQKQSGMRSADSNCRHGVPESRLERPHQSGKAAALRYGDWRDFISREPGTEPPRGHQASGACPGTISRNILARRLTLPSMQQRQRSVRRMHRCAPANRDAGGASAPTTVRRLTAAARRLAPGRRHLKALLCDSSMAQKMPQMAHTTATPPAAAGKHQHRVRPAYTE